MDIYGLLTRCRTHPEMLFVAHTIHDIAVLMLGSQTNIILQYQILVAYLILFVDLLDFDQICPLKQQFVGVELISFQRYSYLDGIYVFIAHQLNVNDSMVY